MFPKSSMKALPLILCLLVHPSAAGARTFTLPQAVAFARQNNGSIKLFREDKVAWETRKEKAWLFPNPVLEMEGFTGKVSGSPTENGLSFGISQQFPTAGKREKRALLAEKEVERSGRQLDDAGRILTAEVKSAFYDFLLAQKRMELAQRLVQVGTGLVEVTRQRVDAGDVAELELNLARVESARQLGRQVEEERELNAAKTRLLSLLAIPSEEQCDFSGTLGGAPIRAELSALKATALAMRPDLQAIESEKGAAEAETSIARAEAAPDVTVGIGWQRENTAIEVAGNEGMSRDNVINLKVSVPIPVFDRNRPALREAASHRASADIRSTSARLAVEREVEGAYAGAIAAEKVVALYSADVIPLSEENLKLVQEAYRQGEVGILTALEEQKKYAEVNEGYLAALYNSTVAQAKLEAAVGVELSAQVTGGYQ